MKKTIPLACFCVFSSLAVLDLAQRRVQPVSQPESGTLPPPVIDSTRIVGGLAFPIYVTQSPGDNVRLFIVEKPGRIRIFNLQTQAMNGVSFLDIDALVGGGSSTNDERGLLGLAFHPNYQSNGFFYVNYTNNSGNTVIARYTVSANPDLADSGSALTLKTITQPETNHNGGCLQFGPDGMLYVGMGDGGGANDQHGSIGNGQNTGTLLGKMLRLDVDIATPYIPTDNPFVGPGNPLDEIWASGLRNPWRFSFDRLTGDLFIADVGQNAVEEINFQAGSSAGGENYGWRCMEGNNCTGLSGCTCNAVSLTDPIHTYGHSCSTGGFSITGGYVYRGCAMPGLQGTYFFADYVCDKIWSFKYNGSSVSNLTLRTSEISPSIEGHTLADFSSFGEDNDGEIYIVDQGSGTNGEVFKIIPAVTGPDCNGNSVADSCDVAHGLGTDCNTNALLDSCDILAGTSFDCDLDGIPDECIPQATWPGRRPMARFFVELFENVHQRIRTQRLVRPDPLGRNPKPQAQGTLSANVQVIAREIIFSTTGEDVPVRVELDINGAGFQTLFGGGDVAVGNEQNMDLGAGGTLTFKGRAAYPDYNQPIFSLDVLSDSTNAIVFQNGDEFNEMILALRGVQEPFDGQMKVACFVAPYFNLQTGTIQLPEGSLLILFELGTTNPNSTAYDFQDLVLLVTPN